MNKHQKLCIFALFCYLPSYVYGMDSLFEQEVEQETQQPMTQAQFEGVVKKLMAFQLPTTSEAKDTRNRFMRSPEAQEGFRVFIKHQYTLNRIFTSYQNPPEKDTSQKKLELLRHLFQTKVDENAKLGRSLLTYRRVPVDRQALIYITLKQNAIIRHWLEGYPDPANGE